jgi:hypothetical protein
MGELLRDRLPDPVSYFESEGVTLQGKGKWRTGPCQFHGSRATMRINTVTGAWVCMAGCGARGGDVLAYHMAVHGMGFVEAAKALGAYRDDGQPYKGSTKPSQPPARALLQAVSDDLYLAAQAVSAVTTAMVEYPILREVLADRLSDADLAAFHPAAGRIIYIAEVARHV